MTSAAIAADSPLTVEAGAKIARQGGNVADIAVSAALAATVSEFLVCSIGGSAFFMIGHAERAAELIEGADAIPTIERRPSESAAWRTASIPYGDGIAVKAGEATVAVPGMLAAAECAWRRHGSLPWSVLVAPALDLARSPILVGATQAKWLELTGRELFWPNDESRRCFYRDTDNPRKEGESIQIRGLDQTLDLIAKEGARAFYEGDLGQVFSREIQHGGGFVTRNDLRDYKPIARKPLVVSAAGYQLALNPPPAVGGSALGLLIRILESHWRYSLSSAEKTLLHARAQAQLLSIRQAILTKPDLDAKTAEALVRNSENGFYSWGNLASPNTTHLSVVTSDGSMAAVTMSIGYGSGVMIPDTGISCNNALGEPELNPQGFHCSTPGTRLPTNMAPTLAWHDDGRRVAFGTPGASRITTSLAQTWARFSLEGMTFEEAVQAPRLHVEPLGKRLCAQFEPGIDSSGLAPEYVLRPFNGKDMYFGAVKLAGVDPHGRFQAVADNRREGAVAVVDK